VLEEALGAIAALQQKRLARSHTAELGLQLARLTGEHERRKGRKLLLDLLKLAKVGVDRCLLDLFAAPALWAPPGCHPTALLESDRYISD
jgi:hypothetical protein